MAPSDLGARPIGSKPGTLTTKLDSTTFRDNGSTPDLAETRGHRRVSPVRHKPSRRGPIAIGGVIGGVLGMLAGLLAGSIPVLATTFTSGSTMTAVGGLAIGVIIGAIAGMMLG